jgi:hypothetical protein
VKQFVDIEEALTWLSDNWERLKEEEKLWEPTQGDLEIRELSEEGRAAFKNMEIETETWIQTDQGLVMIHPQEGPLGPLPPPERPPHQ